jgi:hypothetical protein
MEEKGLAFSYMAGLSESRKASADWVFICQDEAEFPCHSLIVCNASRVLRDMDEAVKNQGDGKIPIPFPGDAKEALNLLECLYLQERPLNMAEVSGLARLSHQWNIPGKSLHRGHLECKYVEVILIVQRYYQSYFKVGSEGLPPSSNRLHPTLF